MHLQSIHTQTRYDNKEITYLKLIAAITFKIKLLFYSKLHLRDEICKMINHNNKMLISMSFILLFHFFIYIKSMVNVTFYLSYFSLSVIFSFIYIYIYI